MQALLEWLSPTALVARGRTAVAEALRAVAAALGEVAAVIDPPGGAAVPDAPPPGADEALPPFAGTRERIAEALQRARSRYDAVSEAPRRTGRGS